MESIVAKLDAALYPAVCSVNTYLSNYILVFLLVAVGLWYSIKTRFVQVRCFGEGMRRVFGNLTLNGKKHDSGMSSFQALATAIAAQVGTGNIVGGSFGYAIKQAVSQGAKRGLFSNEAGMGSTPHAHAQANVKDPHEQGVVAMVGVFIDTFVVLTLNALVIICTLYTADGPLANGYVGDVTSVLSKTNLAQTAFGSVMGASLGAKFVAICLFFFAFSTVLSWNLFGKINAIWLFGKKDP